MEKIRQGGGGRNSPPQVGCVLSVLMSGAASAAKLRRSASARHWRGTEKGGAQRQLEDGYNNRVAVVFDDYADWVHAGLMKKKLNCAHLLSLDPVQ